MIEVFTFFVEIVFHGVRELPDGGKCLANFPDFGRHGADDRGVTLWRWEVDSTSFSLTWVKDNHNHQAKAESSKIGTAAFRGH